jgi:hypothetical protein
MSPADWLFQASIYFPSSQNTKPARRSTSLNGAGFYHTDAGTHGMVAGRMGTKSSGSPTDSPVTASGFR